MKKLGVIFTFVFLLAAIFTGCVSAPDSQRQSRQTASFSDIAGKDWMLLSVQIDGKRTGFDRSALNQTAFSGSFTLKFDAERASGVGAPNRFTAPYSLGEGQNINMALLASTMMASIFEPEGLREHDYFGYLQNIYQWSFANNNLRLRSKTTDGLEVVLIFGLQ